MTQLDNVFAIPSRVEGIKATASKRSSGYRDTELQAIIDSVDFLELIRRDTGEQGEVSGDRIDFDTSPIDGHHGSFSYYPAEGTYANWGGGITSGGSIIDYLMETRKLRMEDAVKELRELAGCPRDTKPAGENVAIHSDLPPIIHANLHDIPPRPPALIDGVLLVGHKMIVTGASKVGKSWLLIELSVAVATGGEWIGFRCKQGRVLYCNFEIDGASFARRLESVTNAMGASGIAVESNVDIWNLRGQVLSMEAFTKELVERCSGGGYSLVILDPAYKLLALAGEENNAKDVASFCASIDVICSRLNSAVVFCHHHSKGAKGDVAAIDRGSGSGVLARDPDAIIDMVQVFQDPDETPALADDEKAFKVDMTLREFPIVQPFNIVFHCPLHRRDDTGATEGFTAHTQQRNAGKASGLSRKDKERLAIAGMEADLMEWMLRDGLLYEGIPSKDVLDRLGISRNTLKSRLEKSERLEYRMLSGNKTSIFLRDVGQDSLEEQPEG